jgi:hypothetical protein
MFRSYDHLVEQETESRLVLNPGPAQQVPIWAVAHATTAAPIYFRAMKIGSSEFRDASFFVQNPTLYAFDEVSQMHGSTPDSVALTVSIGSGNLPKRDFAPGGKIRLSPLSNISQKMRTISSFIQQYNDPHYQMIRNEHHLQGTRRDNLYVRFNVESGLQDVTRGEWKIKKPLLGTKAPVNHTVEKILSATAEYLRQPRVQEQLMVVAERLVSNKRQRAQDVAKWKVVVGID